MDKLKQRLADFLKELNSVVETTGRGRNEISIIFATKYLGASELVSFLRICQELNLTPVTIGENRVQDWQKKFEYIKRESPQLLSLFNPVLIGNLQKNKINKAIDLFEKIHSIDTLALARVLDKRLDRNGEKMPVFLEVNVSGEMSKHGFRTAEFDSTFKELKLLTSLKIEGLMTMAPLVSDPEEVRPIFRTLGKLADRYKLKTSMGTSNDWRIAVEEGSNIIRIGSLLFKSIQI